MRRGSTRLLWLLLTALFVGGFPRSTAADRLTWTITVDGVARKALVDTGKDAATTPSPLVFVFHGATQSGRDMTNLGLAKAWPEATFVYPDGPSRPNSALGMTIPGWQFHPGEYNDQDVRFVDALIKEISATYKVDARQVFSTGFSNGGAFSYLLLTMRPERFAAVAPVAICQISSLKWARTPRPVLITHGKSDPISFSWAEWARNQLLRLNGCGADFSEWARGATNFSTCTSGQPVIWSVHNGGHEWPSGTTPNVVRFFKEHLLPDPAPTVQPVGDVDTSAAFAGTGRAGFAGDGGSATTARFLFPEGLALDMDGGLYTADTGNQRIRKIGPDGMVQTVAGRAASSAFQAPDREGIAANRAYLFLPEAITVDRQGNLFIADTQNRLVRKVTPAGITTVAGKKPVGATISYSADEGPGPQAALSFPTGLAIDRLGRLFIADSENHRVRMVDADGKITTVAGTGVAGHSGDNDAAKLAQLNEPWGLASDQEGNVYVADASNHRVRKLAPDGTISTVAGTGTPGFSGDGDIATQAQLNHPIGLTVDSQGNLFISDQLNYRVRRVARGGMITTVFGGGSGGNGVSPPAPRHYPAGLAVDRAGNLLVADPFHHCIWKVTGVAAPGLVAGMPLLEPQQ